MIIPAADRLQSVQEYYFSKKLRELRSRMAQGEDIINLGIGNPDQMPSETSIKALLKSATEYGNHGYQPYKGIPALRNAFAEWYLNTYGVDLDPASEILPLIGSKEGIMHISMAFLNPGDQVLVPNPGYPTYQSVSKLLGAELISYDLKAENDWYPDFEALSKLDLSRVKIMWVNYPHMPTGQPATAKLFDELVEFGQKNQILICHDNPYSMVLNPAPMSALAHPKARVGVIELNSLSKSHNMAGWRVGVVCAGKEYIEQILKVKSNMDSGMFFPIQQAAVEALNNPYQWHEDRNKVYARRKKITLEILDALDCTYEQNQVGMFVWAKIPSNYSHSEVFSEQILNQCLVFITPGFIFGEQGAQYVRISLCTPDERLEEALSRIILKRKASIA